MGIWDDPNIPHVGVRNFDVVQPRQRPHPPPHVAGATGAVDAIIRTFLTPARGGRWQRIRGVNVADHPNPRTWGALERRQGSERGRKRL